LPESQRPQADAVHAGFEAYRNGDESKLAECLQPIGLTSPFVDWKLLLRGLAAWSNGDDARAVENFKRLNSERLPARSVFGIRASIDGAFRESLDPTQQTRAANMASHLLNDRSGPALRRVQAALGQRKGLSKAFDVAASVLTELGPIADELKPRLAAVMYDAIHRQGERSDLGRFQKVFGKPANDPDFHRLEAYVFESIHNDRGCGDCWVDYERWLARGEANWPKAVIQRARAVALIRAGIAYSNAKTSIGGGGIDALEQLIRQASARMRLDQFTDVPAPTPLFLRAAELAPDWEQPVLEMFAEAEGPVDTAAAIAAAETFAKRQPQALGVRKLLAERMIGLGRNHDAAKYADEAAALNPLDAELVRFQARARLSSARRGAADGDIAAATAALAKLDSSNEFALERHCLLAILELKRGPSGPANEAIPPMLTTPVEILRAALLLHIHAIQVKLKPALKKAFAERLDGAMGIAAGLGLWPIIHDDWSLFAAHGFKFTGQPALEKRIVEAWQSEMLSSPEEQAETGAMAMGDRKLFKPLKAIAPKLIVRFPKNPAFRYLEVVAASGNDPARVTQPMHRKLMTAARQAERSSVPGHSALIPKIEELAGPDDPFDDFLDFFER